MAAMDAWNNSWYVESYELAKGGLTNRDIAKVLGVNAAWYKRQSEIDPALTKALERARNQEAVFEHYLSERLPPELKKYWTKLLDWHAHDRDVTAKADRMFFDEGAERGTRLRKALWVHAYMASNSDATKACRMVCIKKKLLDQWIDYDHEFAELIKELDWRKGNFYESALVKLVAKGEPSAILFANRTYNADRGYGEKSTVNVTGNITHDIVDLTDLNLSLEVMQAIADAVRRQAEPLPSIKELEALHA